MHKLERYEAWQGYLAEVDDFHLYLEDFNFEEMERYHEYLSHESEYRDAYPDFFAQFKLMKPIDIRPLSKNSICIGIQRLKQPAGGRSSSPSVGSNSLCSTVRNALNDLLTERDKAREEEGNSSLGDAILQREDQWLKRATTIADEHEKVLKHEADIDN